MVKHHFKDYVHHQVCLNAEKHGTLRHRGADWIAILLEEFGEVAEHVVKSEIPPRQERNDDELLREIVQMTAVLDQWANDLMEDGARVHYA